MTQLEREAEGLQGRVCACPGGVPWGEEVVAEAGLQRVMIKKVLGKFEDHESQIQTTGLKVSEW